MSWEMLGEKGGLEQTFETASVGTLRMLFGSEFQTAE